MSKRRQKEIIKLINETLISETNKKGGGNTDTIKQLTKTLIKVNEWKKKENE